MTPQECILKAEMCESTADRRGRHRSAVAPRRGEPVAQSRQDTDDLPAEIERRGECRARALKIFETEARTTNGA